MLGVFPARLLAAGSSHVWRLRRLLVGMVILGVRVWSFRRARTPAVVARRRVGPRSVVDVVVMVSRIRVTVEGERGARVVNFGSLVLLLEAAQDVVRLHVGLHQPGQQGALQQTVLVVRSLFLHPVRQASGYFRGA